MENCRARRTSAACASESPGASSTAPAISNRLAVKRRRLMDPSWKTEVRIGGDVALAAARSGDARHLFPRRRRDDVGIWIDLRSNVEILAYLLCPLDIPAAEFAIAREHLFQPVECGLEDLRLGARKLPLR